MRAKREDSMGVRVGDTIIHCNDTFTIIDMKREESSEGMKLAIFCSDPDQADKMQQEQIKQGQIGSQITELLKKLTEKGLGGLGI